MHNLRKQVYIYLQKKKYLYLLQNSLLQIKLLYYNKFCSHLQYNNC